MRRLPVFFVLDCSESMVGENLQQMQQGMQHVMQHLRKDPYALETVHVSVIAFSGIVRTLVPLVEVFAFYPVNLPLGGGTNLGQALEHLMNEIDRHVIKTTEEMKGDWKPIVYLFTDGRPTDRCEDAIYRWNTKLVAHHFCPECGCATFSDSPAFERDGSWDKSTRRIGVNARLFDNFDNFDAAAASVEVIDGKNLW